MKKIFLTLCVAFASIAMYAAGLENVRVYVNPGHGSWGANDRPMATIPYPELPTTGMPDTLGFYESNTNLWKCLELGKKLEEAGAFVMYSRTQNGPWPYQMVNGDYPDYTSAGYKALPDYEKYNRNLVEIREEVDANNMDYFISVHSNATGLGDGTTNYLYLAVRGDGDWMGNTTDPYIQACWQRAEKAWPYIINAMDKGLETASHYSATQVNIRQQSLGVLRHSVPGWLSEGYFHDYAPGRHRALNPDWCRDEGLRYYRGVAAWYGLEGAAADSKGYILGAVKDMHNKMNHPLFTYTAKSHDQYVPCNGATVTLLKGGVKVADYKVDSCYNGVFFFRDLEPGDDYTLEFACDGYKPLFEEEECAAVKSTLSKTKAGESILVYHSGMKLTVKANETTYPVAFLEDTAYVPAPVVYVDYPDQAPAAALGSKYIFENKGETALTIEGTIKRTIGVGDSTIVLSHTPDSVAHLYLINHLTGEIAPISTEGIVADKENAGEYLALSDIVYTCDKKLVGCNYIRCQYGDDNVDAGQKRGVVQFYKWDKLHKAPEKWISSTHSSNSLRSEQGYTLGISGPTNDCYIFYTGAHNRDLGVRFTELVVTDNQIVSSNYHMYNFFDDEEGSLTKSKIGDKYLLTLSPRDTKASWIFDANLIPASERKLVGTNADLEVIGIFPEDAYGKVFTEVNFIKYAGRILSIAPYEVEGKVGGVRIYDVTDGLDNPVLVKANLDLATPIEAKFAAATIKATANDMTVYLIADNKLVTFTTKGVEQPKIKGIYAYGLNVTREADVFTFTFTANDAPTAADLVFFDGETEVGRIAIDAPVAGANEVKVASMQLPGNEGVYFRWGVELRGDVIAQWNVLYKETAVAYKRAFNTVDNSPESDYFGRIYVMDRVGSENKKNGVYVYDQEWKLQNTTNYAGGQAWWRNPTRPAVDSEGTVYFADWGDNHSGIYLADPAHILDGTYTQLFAGTRNTAGVFTYNGASVGSSTPGCHIYGTGKDTKLFVYNEDKSGTLPENGVVVYNLGQPDGSIASVWETAPSAVYTLTGQGNTEGNVWGTSHGFFVSQVRESGNNNKSTTSLKFYDNAGNQQFSSAENGYEDIIDGSKGGGYVVTPDESRLILNNGTTKFLIFDITWEGDVPTLTLVATYNHGLSDIRQMNFDFAGNLITSGQSGFHILSVPTADNKTLTPAKNSLRVIKSSTITGLENADAEQVKVRKIIENGQVVIIRNGVRYNVMGVRLN